MNGFMKIITRWLVALLASVVMANASDIMVSWESNGIIIADGMIPGSTCTVEWASSLEQPFTNASDTIVFNDMVTDSNGMIRCRVHNGRKNSNKFQAVR